MAAVQKYQVVSSMSTSGSNYGSSSTSKVVVDSGGGGGVSDQFPVGLRVLVVDDDTTCLRILEQMLRRCMYLVTTCCQATVALNLLRERKGCFDVVISDVHMPDMDGFKLLELVGLEMDLPVIMMSADGRTSAVMRGIKHGACDYLIKPVRFEELKNIWQHVVRKKYGGSKEPEQSGSVEESGDRYKQGGDDADYASSANEGTDGNEEDDGEYDNDDPSAAKKPRVVWSVELHQQFVSAVNQLGIDKAVPKRILELMNVPGLTRENVASHLQKFRLYLKRLSGVAHQQGGVSSPFYSPVDSNPKLGSLGRLDIQALAASGQIPAQTLAALHAEVLGRPTGTLVLSDMDKPVLLQSSLQSHKILPGERRASYGQPIVKSSIPKQFSQSHLPMEDFPSVFGSWPSNNMSTVNSLGNHGDLNTQNSNMLMQMFQQQQQQSGLSETSHGTSVQPSCVVAPSQSPTSYQAVNTSIHLNQNSTFSSSPVNSTFSSSPVIDYNLLSSQSNSVSVGLGQQIPDVDHFKNNGVLNGYSLPVSVSQSMSSFPPVQADNNSSWQVQNPGMGFSTASKLSGLAPNMNEIQSSTYIPTNNDSSSQGRTMNLQSSTYIPTNNDSSSQGRTMNLGFVNRGTSYPSRFAVDDFDSSFDNVNSVRTSADNYSIGDRVKQETNLEFAESDNVTLPVLQHYSPNDLMSVLSK
ncbi:hypothetical protein MKW92_003575 [Papaver armeniacum]|nr:hypothetical protein MKW92_003575 [Papaver armeniacum]